MKEDFPSLKEIWAGRKDPVMVMKFLAFFSGFEALLFMLLVIGKEKVGEIPLRLVQVSYPLTTMLYFYFHYLAKSSWSGWLVGILYRGIMLLLIFTIF